MPTDTRPAPAGDQTPMSLPRWRAGAEAAVLSVMLIPALLVTGLGFAALGLTSIAFPPLGVYVIVGLASILLRRGGQTWHGLGLRRPTSAIAALGAGLVAAFWLLILATILTILLNKLGLPPSDLSLFRDVLPGNTVLYAQLMVLVVWGSAAIGEEMFARGFLLNRMEILFAGSPAPTALAVLLQAVIFGAAHAYQGLTGMLLTGVIGLALGYVYILSGRNLWIPILAHGFFDSYGVTALYLGADLGP